jgi:amino acid adenylation domain-containing protein
VTHESSPASSVPALAAGRNALEDFLLAGLAAAAPDSVEEIDPETNLLDLGFDSIAATRLAFVLEQALGVRFSVIDLFEHHNVRALAKFLEPRIKEIPTLDDEILYLLRDGRRAPEEPFASTPLQQAYLSARALPRSIGGGGSQVSVDLEVPVDLDLDRLQRALGRLIERHPMLRTVFLKDGRQRVIRDVPDYPIEIVDLRELSNIEKVQRHEAIRAELSNGSFDPDQWPLFHAKVTLLDKGSFRLLFGIDLLLVDFRSLSLMFCELRDLYVDPDRTLEALPVDFGDYMAALQELRESERYAIDGDWWRSRITDFPIPPAIRRSGATYGMQRAALSSMSFEIPSQQWDSLKGQALNYKISASVLLCAAFCEILHRWSGMEAFCLNLPIFDRYPVHKKIDGVVGPFNNNILLAVQWSPERDVWSRAHQLQSDCLEALEHRLFTGVEFARECAQHRKSLLDPIGPVVFTAAIHGEGQEGWGRTCHGTSETPQVWLDCQVIEGQNRVMVRWDYDPNLFDVHALESNFEQFQRCIAWMEKGACTEEPVVTDICTEPESTAAKTLESIVSEQAKHTPHLRAVICSGRYRTYADLEKHANQIANCLVARGVTAGSLVAIVMERSIEMVEAVLGTLKASCVYVPIDPDYPTKRVEYLLNHSEARMVLSQARLSEELPGTGTPVLDVTGSEVASMPDYPPDRRRSPNDLAYVIYTSGSTGTPKGVMISHGAAINTIVDINQRFAVTKFDRILGFSSLSFDLSVWDIFGTLSTGGTLVILPRDSLKSPSRWFDLIEREGITIWNSVPTGMKMLLDFCEGRRVCEATTLRLVMLSGDWIPLDLPGRIKSYFQDCEVISLGGATEASIWSICYPIETVDPQWKSIPYGKPLTNQSFHVLDNQLQSVPDGEVGELCIGGHGVAMGYYKEPQRTARSFAPDPSTKQILYRTGDLGRMMDDGNIEILGRVDSQVKIRGFRVELAEIEAVLQSHPAVDSGAITVRGEREAHELVAHFVPKGQGVSVQELRGYLRTFLPDYMIPQKFLERSSMPLNPNGKIDRGALNESST